MKPAYGLELIQTQKLVLTPELHQAIMILQMNVQELSALLLEEVETNPLLELAGHIAEKSYDDSPGDEEDWIAYFFDSSDLGLGGREARRSSGGLSDEWRPLDYAPVQPNTSIRGHLLSQLGVLHLTEKEQAIACFIIESIDDNGYLKPPPRRLPQLRPAPRSRLRPCSSSSRDSIPRGCCQELEGMP